MNAAETRRICRRQQAVSQQKVRIGPADPGKRQCLVVLQMNAPVNVPFNAVEWIARQQPSLRRFVLSEHHPLLHFALMWNIFEGEACECSASIDKLRRVAETLAARQFATHHQAVAFMAFLRSRYWRDKGLTTRFVALRFRTPKEEELVSRVLGREATSAADTIFAQLLVVYRYRNNTFHGLKTITDIFGSAELFDESARFLAATMEVS